MKSPKNSLLLFTVVLITLFAASCNRAHGVGQQENAAAPAQSAPAAPVAPPPTLEQIQYSFRQVAQSVLPVVVEINTIEVVSQTIPRVQSPFDFFFGPGPNGPGEGEEREFRRPGLGSGVLVRKDGNKVYVLTNNHVVGEADEISIRLYDAREFTGKLVGTDPRRDLAVVVFETKEEVPIARLGNSDQLQVGDLVLAVGNPFGFESTVTSGIVSALGRQADNGSSIASFTDYIQTDAAINPGNSGGALANLTGEVIGINTWIASQTGQSTGLGFAVPINNAKKAIDDFITKGRVEYGWLGVQIGDLDPRLYPGFAEDFGLDDQEGAFVFNIFKGSPAYKAGIRPGDYIVSVDSRPVDSADTLTKIVGNLPPGDPSSFKLIRSGETVTLSIKLSVREEEKKIAAQSKNLWPGLYVSELTEEIREQLEIPAATKGLVIRFVVEETPAAIAGFKQGDVIQKIKLMMRILREGSEVLLGLVR